MERPMKRKDKRMTEEEVSQLLQRCESGVLATVGEDGCPYAVPVNYACHGEALYFHCATQGHKMDNISFNPKVSFCVVGETRLIPEKFTTWFESVIIFGTARELFEDDKIQGLMHLVQRFSPDHVAAGETYIRKAAGQTRVFRIDIEQMTGKSSRKMSDLN